MTIEPNSIHLGDCLEIVPAIPDESIDAIITDPPYELGFMNRGWDKSGIAFNAQVWAECLRVLKPGGYLLCFTGKRTGHRVACAIEDAGFIIRDEIVWVYREGFPKSMDISKAIDAAARVEREVIGYKLHARDGDVSHQAWIHNKTSGILYVGGCQTRGLGYETAPATEAAKQWEGYGTGIKPAHENIILCMKPLSEKTFVENVLKHGTGALNIDGCRIPIAEKGEDKRLGGKGFWNPKKRTGNIFKHPPKIKHSHVKGRFPSNVIVTNDALNEGKRSKSNGHARINKAGGGNVYGDYNPCITYGHDDDGSPSRYFDIDRWYKSVVQFPKASQVERHAGCEGLEKSGSSNELADGLPNQRNRKNKGAGNFHPTVKPIALLAWLVNLVARPGCLVLDPFGGSGSTAIACIQSQVDYILIEKEKDYVKIARRRIKAEMEQPWLIDLRKEVKN